MSLPLWMWTYFSRFHEPGWRLKRLRKLLDVSSTVQRRPVRVLVSKTSESGLGDYRAGREATRYPIRDHRRDDLRDAGSTRDSRSGLY